MKELVYNNPDFCKQRAESKPLSEDETSFAVGVINTYINYWNMGETDIESIPAIPLIQRFIWEFENLRHFKAVHEGKSCNNCEVNYEIVKVD